MTKKEWSKEEIMRNAYYFHGYLPRSQVEKLLEKEGDWLAFEETKEDIPITVVAVRKGASEKVHVAFYRIRLGITGKMYAEADNGFDCLESLVAHYSTSKTPLVKAPKAPLLLRPVPLESWQVLHDELITDTDTKLLGSGCFGQVLKMKLKKEGAAVVTVAVKECTSQTPKDREAFFREGMMTIRAQCPYVVAMHGISTLSPPIRMVLEFLSLGDLASFLKSSSAKATSEKKKFMSTWQLTKFAADTAAALAHVASLHMIHLDIATRNCLLKPESGGVFRAVLSDFGLSRDGPTYTIQEDDPISQRWAAPETLKQPATATTKSDVWSYGVMLWEIFSFASVPYPELENTQGLLVRLELGHRMSPPKTLPDSLHKLLSDTWAIDPASRPPFSDILASLTKVLGSLPKDK